MLLLMVYPFMSETWIIWARLINFKLVAGMLVLLSWVWLCEHGLGYCVVSCYCVSFCYYASNILIHIHNIVLPNWYFAQDWFEIPCMPIEKVFKVDFYGLTICIPNEKVFLVDFYWLCKLSCHMKSILGEFLLFISCMPDENYSGWIYLLIAHIFDRNILICMSEEKLFWVSIWTSRVPYAPQ